LTLFEISSDEGISSSLPDQVRVVENHLGKAVNSVRSYPAGSVIGEIVGRVFNDNSGADDYTFEYDDQLMEPEAPFRFLNHSCAPNCEQQVTQSSAVVNNPNAAAGLSPQKNWLC